MLNIPSLTGVRAIAAYMVFFHHYLTANCQGQFWCSLVMEFHTGVTLFFVLSGFLITYRYYHSSNLHPNWFFNYLKNRIARIMPLVFIITLLTLIVTQNKSFSDWFLSLSLLKGFSPQTNFLVISQTWSLTVEWCFYFFAPFLFFFLKKGTSLFLIFLALFLTSCFLISGGVITNPNQFASSHIFFFIYTFFGRSFEFFIGVFLALFILQGKTKNYKFFTYLGLLFIFLTFLAITNFQSTAYRYGIFTLPGLLIANFLLPISITIFFYGLITEQTIIKNTLSTKLFILLGESSYAFYLIHIGVLADLIPSFFRTNLFIFFLTLNLISIFLFFTLEKPLNKFVKLFRI